MWYRIWKPINGLFSLHKSQLIGHSPCGHAISSRLDGSLVIITITVQQRLQFYLIIHLWSSCFHFCFISIWSYIIGIFYFQLVINIDYALYQNMYLVFAFNIEDPDLTTTWPLIFENHLNTMNQLKSRMLQRIKQRKELTCVKSIRWLHLSKLRLTIFAAASH